MNARVSQTGGHRDPTLGGCTQSLTCTGTQGKAVTPWEPGLDLTAGLGGSPRKGGIGCGSLLGQGPWWQTPQVLLLSVLSLEDCHFGTKTWSHATLYGSSAGLPQVEQQQGGHTAISISRQAASKHTCCMALPTKEPRTTSGKAPVSPTQRYPTSPWTKTHKGEDIRRYSTSTETD